MNSVSLAPILRNGNRSAARWTFAFALAVALTACASNPNRSRVPAFVGEASQRAPELYLDHVPVAVHSLETAVQTYGKRLGFRIKPGRMHPNGLRNAFVKFPDGSYLELITADSATDELARWYVGFLHRQEGGAFLSLRADSLPALARLFENHGYAGSLQRYGRAFSILSFSDSALESVFLIEYPEPVRDSAALLEHPNTALGLDAVWLPRSTFDALTGVSSVFRSQDHSVVPLARGMIVISEQPSTANVVGVTIRVRSIVAAQEALRNGTGEDLPIRQGACGRSIRVPPRLTHGIWIEFVESPAP